MLKVKGNDMAGAAFLVSIVFALSSCSFEKPDPQTEELDKHVEELVAAEAKAAEDISLRSATSFENSPVGAGFSVTVTTDDDANSVADTGSNVEQPDGASSYITPATVATGATEQSSAARDTCAIATTANGDLAQAKRIYEDVCAGYPRPDCDPAEGGGWQCASVQIGAGSPPWVEDKLPLGEVIDIVIDIPDEDVPDEPVEDEKPEEPDPIQPPSGGTRQVESVSATGDWKFVQNPAGYEGSGAYIWLGRNNFFVREAGSGILSYDFAIETAGSYEITVRSHITDGPSQPPQAPDANNDVWLRVNNGGWTKVFQQRRGQWTNTLPLTIDLPAGTTTVQLSGRSQYFVVDSITVKQKGQSVPVKDDLYVLHYDVCPDRDDIQAMVANHIVLDKLGIAEVQATIGTCGYSITDRYSNAGLSLFLDLHPDGLNAHEDRAGAIAAAAAQWTEALSSGHNVFVAEGGQSDFTADVVRRISAGLRGRITVVQHSFGPSSYNEGFTSDSNLAFLRNNVNYVNVANGNAPNATANLATWQQGIYDPDPFIDAALDSKYSRYWVEAFNQLSPYCRPQSYQCRIDFSDTVELLYFVGDTTTKNVNDFASKYFQ